MERMRRGSRATTFEGERVALLKCTSQIGRVHER
jgi:hypothetical protein